MRGVAVAVGTPIGLALARVHHLDVCRGGTGHIQDRKCRLLRWLEVVCHSDNFDRFARQIERSDIILALPVAPGGTTLPGHVDFKRSIFCFYRLLQD